MAAVAREVDKDLAIVLEHLLCLQTVPVCSSAAEAQEALLLSAVARIEGFAGRRVRECSRAACAVAQGWAPLFSARYFYAVHEKAQRSSRSSSALQPGHPPLSVDTQLESMQCEPFTI